jgi:hypothetical protein
MGTGPPKAQADPYIMSLKVGKPEFPRTFVANYCLRGQTMGYEGLGSEA